MASLAPKPQKTPSDLAPRDAGAHHLTLNVSWRRNILTLRCQQVPFRCLLKLPSNNSHAPPLSSRHRTSHPHLHPRTSPVHCSAHATPSRVCDVYHTLFSGCDTFGPPDKQPYVDVPRSTTDAKWTQGRLRTQTQGVERTVFGSGLYGH